MAAWREGRNGGGEIGGMFINTPEDCHSSAPSKEIQPQRIERFSFSEAWRLIAAKCILPLTRNSSLTAYSHMCHSDWTNVQHVFFSRS